MREWFASLAACAVLSEIADALSPPGWREHIRRIAALAVLAVLLLPLRGLRMDHDRLSEMGDALSCLSGSGTEEGSGTDAVGRESWAAAAELVFGTAENLGLDPGRMTVRFCEEGGELTSVFVSAPGSPYVLRAALEEELSEAFGVPAEVTGGG